MDGDNSKADEIKRAKIRRALLSGPDCITRDATVAEMDAQEEMTVLRQGTNQWVCVPGNENIIGQADMCLDPMGMRWMLDVMARKYKPSNTTVMPRSKLSRSHPGTMPSWFTFRVQAAADSLSSSQ